MFLILTFLTGTIPSALALPEITNLRSDLPPELQSKIDDVGTQIPELIFNSLSHFDVSAYSSSYGSLGLGVDRQVRNNGRTEIRDHQAVEFYTVTDHFKVKGSIPLFSGTVPVPTVMTNLNFYIGTNEGIVFTDVRQVARELYNSLPTIESRSEEIRQSPEFSAFIKNTQSKPSSTGAADIQGQWLTFVNQAGKKINSFVPADAQSFARYSSLWNLGLLPFRLPLKKDGFAKMEKDEIISYEGQGSIQTGMGVGWSLDPTNLVGILNAGASIGAWVSGTFRISILKRTEPTDPNNTWIAYVKISRIADLGTNWSAGFGYYPGLLGGILIVSALDDLFKIEPFKITEGTNKTRTFETTFAYDLSTHGGQNAYEYAVLGDLRPSIELARNPKGLARTNLKETGVIKKPDMKSVQTGKTFTDDMNFTFLYRQNTHTSDRNTFVKISEPNGKIEKEITAEAVNVKEWATILGQSQKFQTSFQVEIDQEALDKDPCMAAPETCLFPLHFTGSFNDSRTTQAALLYYMVVSEDLVGIPGLFPRTPIIRDLRHFDHAPFHPFDFYNKGDSLGGSRFDFRLDFTGAQVEAFIRYDQELMWPALGTAFNHLGSWDSEGKRWLYGITRAPLTFFGELANLFQGNIAEGTDLFQVERFYEKWLNLRQIKNPIKRAEALVACFADHNYSLSFAKLLRTVLQGNSVPYYVSGSNQTFGDIERKDITQLTSTDKASEMIRKVDFQIPTESEMDANLKVNGFRLRNNEAGDLVLEFEIPSIPERLYLDATQVDWLTPTRNRLIFSRVFDAAPLNLKVGKNIIEIGAGHPLADFAKTLCPDITYRVRMAISSDPAGTHWGLAESEKYLHIVRDQNSLMHRL